jgi:peptidoglycan/LPS O-acetylase OafA/YrhL
MTLSLLRSGVKMDANHGVLFMPLLRAFCGLCYGVLVYYFTTTPWCDAIKRKKNLFNIAVLLSLVCIFLYADYGSIHYITGGLLIIGCLEESSWINKVLNRPCFRHCSKLSYSIYVNHALVCRFVNGFLKILKGDEGQVVLRPHR